MNILLAMGVPMTNDRRGYFLWLAHNWQFLMPAAMAMLVILFAFVAGVVRMIRRGRDGTTPGASTQADPQSKVSDLSGATDPSRGPDPDSQGPWRIELAAIG
jgi:hypothetical protein